ncbi:MAG: hypothetical protein WB810_07160 [Candidatus Cybelea sp.]
MRCSCYRLGSCAAAAMLAGCVGSQPPTLAARGQGFATIPLARASAGRYRFRTLDNPADPTYNDLTGINNAGVISGFYGGGGSGHPTKGYTLAPPYTRSSYTSENYPRSTQTQVIGIDSLGNIVGTFVDSRSRSWGFIKWNGRFKRYRQHPLYGLNNGGNSVVNPGGYYNNTIYALNQATRKRTLIYTFTQGYAWGVGLNDTGDVVGSARTPILAGFNGWAILDGVLYSVDYSYCSSIAIGINNNDEVVGAYACGRAPYQWHGFVLTKPLTHPKYETVDDHSGVQTTINGVNDKGDLVGTYVDSAGSTHGFLAEPR